MIQSVSATITTAADGTATVYVGSKIRGRIHAIKYVPGTIVTGADLTITGNTHGTPIVTLTDAGTSTVWVYPRALASKVADGSDATDAFVDIYLEGESMKVAVAQGGATKTGTITLFFEE